MTWCTPPTSGLRSFEATDPFTLRDQLAVTQQEPKVVHSHLLGSLAVKHGRWQEGPGAGKCFEWFMCQTPYLMSWQVLKYWCLFCKPFRFAIENHFCELLEQERACETWEVRTQVRRVRFCFCKPYILNPWFPAKSLSGAPFATYCLATWQGEGKAEAKF